MSTAQTTTVVNRPALAGVVARVQAAVACLPVTPPGVAIAAVVASPPPAHWSHYPFSDFCSPWLAWCRGANLCP